MTDYRAPTTDMRFTIEHVVGLDELVALDRFAHIESDLLSGVLDEYPDVKIILGHLGETLPFLLWRIDMAVNRPGNEGVAFRDAFTSHFYITTSGFFSDPALLCCIQEMGADRTLFAIDYPFVPNEPGPAWMERLMLNSEDKAKILHGNAEKLLGL